MQTNDELPLIRAALENLERTVEASGGAAPITRAILRVFPAETDRREAVTDTLDWFEDAMREARRRAHRLAFMAQDGVKAPPPR